MEFRPDLHYIESLQNYPELDSSLFNFVSVNNFLKILISFFEISISLQFQFHYEHRGVVQGEKIQLIEKVIIYLATFENFSHSMRYLTFCAQYSLFRTFFH